MNPNIHDHFVLLELLVLKTAFLRLQISALLEGLNIQQPGLHLLLELKVPQIHVVQTLGGCLK
jgi:hypothetical protein